MELKCKKCKIEFDVGQKITIKANHYESNKQIIKCPKCKSSELHSVMKPGEGYGSFMSFSSKSLEEKSKFFKQRAKKHAASKAEKEKRQAINKQIDNNLIKGLKKQ